ncbi:hypothetical protein OGM63_15900 [Plectonema radiosum NIES-515]|uniref:Uncharacterized protein n=1 Tax=Plectonema radiosum NIES-515 TaxID=2986073 RepID=A0ABT3B0T3_9CYAN|nr:hypothetical protein [Plectonema radiosum]MCV3214979.1 hypothetical protein [Plectonema radiosum NIES-515]
MTSTNIPPWLNHVLASPLRSLLGQVMSVSLDGNRQERSRGFINIFLILSIPYQSKS